jgi:Tol biopolymer transport system component
VSGLRCSTPLSLYFSVHVFLFPLLLSAQVPGSINTDPHLSWHTEGHDRIVRRLGSCPDRGFAAVPGSITIDPRLGWYTLETDHFDVHFSCRGRPDSSDIGLAREVADIAEEVHATVTPVVGWTPRARTQIVIADFYDHFNGWAAPFPNNTITIIPTPPGGSKSNEGDWLRTLILHEYSHILQTDQVAGVPAALRHVFGRVSMPNALAPTWLNEGYAVYNETRFSDFGRLRSAEYDMIARAAADSKRLLPVDRCGTYELQRYPGGSAPYLYGSWLHGDAVARSDSGIWDRYNRRRSAGFPFLENSYARRTLGRSIYRAWNETRDDLIAGATRTAALLQMQPLTQLQQVTHEGYSTSSPLWSRYGTRLYYISETGREFPAIKLVETATHRTLTLHRGLVMGNLSLSPDGRELAFAELNRTGNYYEHTEIYALDISSGSVRQLTRGQRARDPDFAPDTSLLVFVSNGRGQNDLKLLDLKTGKASRLTETEDHTAYHSPRFSPGGKWIAVGVSRPGGYADIELVDRHTGWTVRVTHDRANDLSPAWSRTGKFLFYVSDRTGVFNLYAYQLATGETFQVTNVRYGVFEPAISPDNRRIAVTSYSASGYDISVTDLNSVDWQPAPEFTDTLPTTASQPETMNEERGTKNLFYYNPFPGLLPAFWLPWASLSDENQVDELGAFTLGWDALQFHQYQIMAGYRFSRSSPFLTAAYTLRRYTPVVGAWTNIDLHRQEGSINFELPFLETKRSRWLDLALTATRTSTVTTRADLDWTFSDAHQYRFDVAPVEGRVLGFHTDARSRSLLSDRNLTRMLGYRFQYFGNPPQTWSLHSKLALGSAFGEAAPDAFVLGSEPGLLGVRGYTESSEPGRTVLAAGLQFRTPLWWVERGIGTGPLFLQNINAAAFAEAGLTSDWPASRVIADSALRDARVGVGAELRADLILSHLLPVSVFAGCGFGLNPLWSYRLYFGVSSSMLTGILESRDTRSPNFRHLPEAR